MRIGHLEAGFPFGILVIADSRADMGQLPDGGFGESRLVAGPGIALFRVMHDVDGQVNVDVVEHADAIDPSLHPAGSTELLVLSGTLIISDAEGKNSVFAVIGPGRYSLYLFADDPQEAEVVAIKIRQA